MPTKDSTAASTLSGDRLVSWAKEACFVIAVIANSSLEHRVAVQINESSEFRGRGVACIRQEKIWKSNALTCAQEQGAYEATPFRCSFVPTERAKMQTSQDMPAVSWITSVPDVLFSESVCWSGSGTCVSLSEAPLKPILPLLHIEGLWFAETKEPAGNHIEALVQQSHDISCAVFHIQDPSGTMSQCGGCAKAFRSNSTTLFPCTRASLASVRAEIETPKENVQRVNIHIPSGTQKTGLHLTLVSPDLAKRTNPRIWTCYSHVKNESQWSIRSSSNTTTEPQRLYLFERVFHPEKFTAILCNRPLPTWGRTRRVANVSFIVADDKSPQSCVDANGNLDLFEDSQNLHVWKRLKRIRPSNWTDEFHGMLNQIAPGLWQGPNGSFFMLNPIKASMWWIPEDGAPELCLSTSQPKSEVKLQLGKSMSPPELPLTCPSGKSPLSSVSIQNTAGPFFYRVPNCEIREMMASLPCRCPWRWAETNKSVSVDGATLLHSCALWTPEQRTLHSWRLNGIAPKHDDKINATAASHFLDGRHGIFASCPKSDRVINACSENKQEHIETPGNQCRSCLPDHFSLAGRCFAQREARGRKQTRKLLFQRGPKPSSPPQQRDDICEPLLSESALEQETDDSAAIAMHFEQFADGMMSPNFPLSLVPPSDRSRTMNPIEEMLRMRTPEPQRILQNIILPGDSETISGQIAAELVITPPGASRGPNQIALVDSRSGAVICSIGDSPGARAYPVHYATWSSPLGESDPWIFITLVTPSTPEGPARLLNYKIINLGDHKYIFQLQAYLPAWKWSRRLDAGSEDVPMLGASDTVLVEPHAGPRGGAYDLEASIIIDRIRGTWAPFLDDPDFGGDVALAFTTNFYYMTSHITNLPAPPYVFDPRAYRRTCFRRTGYLHPESLVYDLDWRIFHTLVPVASLWRKNGKLAVAFKLENKMKAMLIPGAWRDKSKYLRDLGKQGEPSCPYVIIEFSREPEIENTEERHAREFEMYERVQRLGFHSGDGETLTESLAQSISEPPEISLRNSRRHWMRAVRWRFILGIQRGSSQLQDVPFRGLLLWQVPDILKPRRYRRNLYPGTASFSTANGAYLISPTAASSRSSGGSATRSFWIPDSLLDQSQTYTEFTELTLQPNVLATESIAAISGKPLPYTQVSTHVIVMDDATGLNEGEVRLALLTYPLVFRNNQNRGETRQPSLNFVTLRTTGPRSGLLTPTPLVELPIHESRSTRAARRWQPWQPTDPSFLAWRSSTFHSGLLRHSREPARLSWLPLTRDLLEFGVVADQIIEGPEGGVLTVRVRRPVLRSRATEDTGNFEPAREHSAVMAAIRNSAHSALDLEPNACLLYRQATGSGRGPCRACHSISTLWPRTSMPARVRVPISDFIDIMETDTNDVLLNDAEVHFEELGSIAIRLRFPSESLPEK